jgi:hypothetical protein
VFTRGLAELCRDAAERALGFSLRRSRVRIPETGAEMAADERASASPFFLVACGHALTSGAIRTTRRSTRASALRWLMRPPHAPGSCTARSTGAHVAMVPRLLAYQIELPARTVVHMVMGMTIPVLVSRIM